MLKTACKNNAYFLYYEHEVGFFFKNFETEKYYKFGSLCRVAEAFILVEYEWIG
jgi:hypothetical protein